MRRTIFLALLAALLLVPTAHAAGPIQVIRDCEDDGVLQGSYSPSELRNARRELPTDIDEYSDCRDVLSRALSSSTSSSGAGGASSGGGGASGSSAGGGGGSESRAGGGGGSSGPAAPDTIVGPTAPEDWAAIAEAGKSGGRPVAIGGRPVSPGSTRLAADVGRNSLPTTLLVVLALLAAGGLAAAGAPLIRRRALAHRA